MKSKAFRALLLLALFAAIACGSFYGGRWWTQRKKQKALSEYLQKTSPVTLRMPADTMIYLNLYKLNSIYSDLEKTRLSRVLAHWMDTGMKDEPEKPNPVMGGMLEKMILNVFGEEVGVGIKPMNEKELDFIAIARLAPGSDFLIRLALSQNKKLGRESLGDATVYSYQSRNPQVPLLYIYVDANFAYLASSLATLKNSLVPGAGPAFLKTGIQESLSENTFLFARCADPEITLTAAGRNNHFQFHARTGALLSGAIPSRMGASPVLELLTNAPRILKQPSASIAIHEVDGAPVSTLLLAFQDRQRAERFKTKVENKFTDGIASESIEELQAPEVNCLRFPYRDVQRTLCVKDQLFMQTEGSIDPLALLKDAGVAAAQKRPLTLQVSFQKKAVAEYGEMADEDDWSRFPSARAFYFLSCIRDIRGGIGSGQDEISIDIE